LCGTKNGCYKSISMLSNKSRTAVVVLTWNGLERLQNTLETFHKYNGYGVPVYIVDNRSTDGTIEFIKKENKYNLVENNSNLGIFLGTFAGLNRVVDDGYDFVINVQNDFPSLYATPIDRLQTYLDANLDVGFVRLNDKKDKSKNLITNEKIVYDKWEALSRKIRIAKSNYHISFNPNMIRCSIVKHLSQTDKIRERGMMEQFEMLGLRSAKINPPCYKTFPCRDRINGWTH